MHSLTTNTASSIQMTPQVCGIWEAGKLHVVKYGSNDFLGSDHPLHKALLQQHLRALLDAGHTPAAACLLQMQPGPQAALVLFLEAAGHEAAQLFARNLPGSLTLRVLGSAAGALHPAGLHELAGDMYAWQQRPREALACYTAGHAHAKAVEVAVLLGQAALAGAHKAWGDWLMEFKHHGAAVEQFRAAGDDVAAFQAAMAAQDLQQASEVIQSVQVCCSSFAEYLCSVTIPRWVCGTGHACRTLRPRSSAMRSWRPRTKLPGSCWRQRPRTALPARQIRRSQSGCAQDSGRPRSDAQLPACSPVLRMTCWRSMLSARRTGRPGRRRSAPGWLRARWTPLCSCAGAAATMTACCALSASTDRCGA